MAKAQISLITTYCDRPRQLAQFRNTMSGFCEVVIVKVRMGWRGLWGDVVVGAELPFNLAAWRNLGAKAASGAILFFCDVDMLLPPTFAAECRKNVKPGHVWFPMCLDLSEDGTPEPAWRETGFGNCGIMREDFEKLGGWNEARHEWGKEDGDFRDKVRDAGMTIVRKKLYGLFHQWHPTTPEFLNKYRG